MLDTLVQLARSGRTVVVVAHRPSVLAVADEVVRVRALVLTGGGGAV